MAQNVTLYNLLISCPGDVKEEVVLIESAVDEFNELYAEALGITIKTRHWSKSLMLSLVENHRHYLTSSL